MSRFYGTLSGDGAEVTRTGHKSSGVETYAAGWKGAVRTYVYDNGGEDWCVVELTKWRGSGTYHVLYRGPVNPADVVAAGKSGERHLKPV